MDGYRSLTGASALGRCELVAGTAREGETFLYQNGDRRLTYVSIRVPAATSLNGPRSVMRMTGADNLNHIGSVMPNDAVALQIYDAGGTTRWRVQTLDGTPLAAHWGPEVVKGQWIRFAFDITYSCNQDLGSIEVYADLNGDGDADDAQEHSPAVDAVTMGCRKWKVQEPAGPFTFKDPVPSHLRVGVHQANSCAATGCSVDVDNTQILVAKPRPAPATSYEAHPYCPSSTRAEATPVGGWRAGTDGNEYERATRPKIGDAELIATLGGHDRIDSFAGFDCVDAGDESDVIFTGQAADWAWGGAGDDWLYGDGSQERLMGGEGSDTLFGGASTEILDGGPPSGDAESDYCYSQDKGATVRDCINVPVAVEQDNFKPKDPQAKKPPCNNPVAFPTSPLIPNPPQFEPGELTTSDQISQDGRIFTAWGDGSSDCFNGTDGPDWFDGGPGNDYIIGRGNADTIYGGDGDFKDILIGDGGGGGAAEAAEAADGPTHDPTKPPGVDFLLGGPGNDILRGGDGPDELYGGAGKNDICIGGPDKWSRERGDKVGNDRYRGCEHILDN